MRRCGLSRLIYLVEGNTAHATLGRGKSIPFAMIASQVSRSGVGCAAAVVGLTPPPGSLSVCVRVCACVRACVYACVGGVCVLGNPRAHATYKREVHEL